MSLTRGECLGWAPAPHPVGSVPPAGGQYRTELSTPAGVGQDSGQSAPPPDTAAAHPWQSPCTCPAAGTARAFCPQDTERPSEEEVHPDAFP